MKPLNVQVAEALGCKPGLCQSPAHTRFNPAPWACTCVRPHHHEVLEVHILPYGEDTPEGWACTGPLAKRFGISTMAPSRDVPEWACLIPEGVTATGTSPCEAIARCVVALHEAGRK